jgi:hypothetical protein
MPSSPPILSATIFPMSRSEVVADNLEDDDIEASGLPARDLTRPIRKLAAAVLVQAVMDSKLQDAREREDAVEFLNPKSIPARHHLRRMAELANVSLAWLSECVARCVTSPLPKLRPCLKCKATMPVSEFVPHYDGSPGRLCHPCREATAICPRKRGSRKASRHSGFSPGS